MSGTHLQSIYRYPIKGFRGQKLSEAHLAPGKGIAFDRFLGFANGSASISQDSWSPCQGFVRMTRNKGLPLFGIDFDEDTASLSIETPTGNKIRIDLTDSLSLEAADVEIATLFPTIGSDRVGLVRRSGDLGWWDYEDAAISIINADTVALLSRKAGQVLDALRFPAIFTSPGFLPGRSSL